MWIVDRGEIWRWERSVVGGLLFAPTDSTYETPAKYICTKRCAMSGGHHTHSGYSYVISQLPEVRVEWMGIVEKIGILVLVVLAVWNSPGLINSKQGTF